MVFCSSVWLLQVTENWSFSGPIISILDEASLERQGQFAPIQRYSSSEGLGTFQLVQLLYLSPEAFDSLDYSQMHIKSVAFLSNLQHSNFKYPSFVVFTIFPPSAQSPSVRSLALLA